MPWTRWTTTSIFFSFCIISLSVFITAGILKNSVISTLSFICTAISTPLSLVFAYLQWGHPQLNPAPQRTTHDVSFLKGSLGFSVLIGIIIPALAFCSTIISVTLPSPSVISFPISPSPSVVSRHLTSTPSASVSSFPTSTQPAPTPLSVTLTPPFFTRAPGCNGDSSLHQDTSIFMVSQCPSQGASTVNPYNDFQAKDENRALSDSGGSPLVIAGRAEIHTGKDLCLNGCIINANILFHDESLNFRQSTMFGILLDKQGICVDRNGNVYIVSLNAEGQSMATPSQQLNFPTGSNLTANNNPINLQIDYSSHKNVTFQVSYKSTSQSQTQIWKSNSSELSAPSGNNVIDIFSQMNVNPSQYAAAFQRSSIDFGDSSIIGMGEITVAPKQ